MARVCLDGIEIKVDIRRRRSMIRRIESDYLICIDLL